MKFLIKALCIASVATLVAACGGASSPEVSPGVFPVVGYPPLVWDQDNWDEVEWQ